MRKSIQELLNELDKRLEQKETEYDILLKKITKKKSKIKEKEKVSGLPKEKEHILLPLNDKQNRLLSTREVKQNLLFEGREVKQKLSNKLSNSIIYQELSQGLRPIDISKKYKCSKSAVTQRLKKLEAKNLAVKHNKEWRIKKIVKQLSLPMTTSDRNKYEFQTIQIIIPLKNPERLDLVKWDKYVPELKQSFKKYPYFKFTLNKTTKSIRLFLHSRYIERPEDIVTICKNYVNLVAKQLKKYDIELNKEEARTSGLHLWKKDKVVGEEYEKEDGFIGAYHGIDTTPILPKDNLKERKTWIDSTPSPDGIESNDYQYFLDKKAMEFFVGEPKEKLQEYMKKPTEFISTMNGLMEGIKADTKARKEDTQARYLEVYNRQLHRKLLENIGSGLNDQSNIFKEQLKVFRDIRQELRTERKIKNIEKEISEENIGIKPKEVEEDIVCPFCKSSFAKKLLLERDFVCPNRDCLHNLKLYFPELGKT